MKLEPAEWIGKRVEVVVDRPLGSVHPEFPDLKYEVNYGYVPGTMAADEAEIDVYILGVGQAVARFEGEVIAIIERRNDIEDKLVVAEGARSFSTDEIMESVRFQERYWDSTVLV